MVLERLLERRPKGVRETCGDGVFVELLKDNVVVDVGTGREKTVVFSLTCDMMVIDGDGGWR